jgi:nucleotide-binding universal stress UspA family protein
MRSIVVGVDESPGAAAALRWAAAERDVHDCTLTAVLCWTYLEQHRNEPDQHFDPEYGDEEAGQALDAIVAATLGASAEVVARRTVNDRTSRGLLEASADDDLLVLGARGLGGLRGMVLGSVTRQCLHHAAIPVAVLHHDPDDEPPADPIRPGSDNRIVVGVDGSETSKSALAWSVDEARLRRARVTAVHAWMPPYVGAELVPAAAFETDEYERRGSETLASVIDGIDTEGLEAPVERRVVSDAPASALVAAAEGADLLVVGSRGVGGFKGLLLGSISHHVTHHARCPVVVIPHAH